MSATIATNDLKFVAFGAGHDYTRLDSGLGQKPFFSHPKVPLNSVNYAGQYYFLVPDENGELFDAVKDDVAHCTFTPAIGTTFATEGDTTVSVKYRREYIHDEETILVEKELTQTVEVVNHGAVSTSAGKYDIYADGYIFWRPSNVNTVSATYYSVDRNVSRITASSNIPWRATGLGYEDQWTSECFIHPNGNVDLSELADADLSNCTVLHKLIYQKRSTDTVDLTPLGEWDVSNVTYMGWLFYECIDLDISPLEKWNTESVTDMEGAFYSCDMELNGVENWDVSSVTDMSHIFDGLGDNSNTKRSLAPLANWNTESVTNMSYAFNTAWFKDSDVGLASWDVSNVTNMTYIFAYCGYDSYTPVSIDFSGVLNWNVENVTDLSYAFAYDKLTDVDFLVNWKTSSATTLERMFYYDKELSDISGLANWDVSSVVSFKQLFTYCWHVNDISALSGWDVGKGENFSNMFGGWYMNDLSPLANWDMSSAKNTSEMFGCVHELTSVSALANWDMSHVTNARRMFWAHNSVSYNNGDPSQLSYWTYEDYDYSEAGYYFTGSYNKVSSIFKTTPYLYRDASGLEGWNIASGAGAFYNSGSDSAWQNVPSWN